MPVSFTDAELVSGCLQGQKDAWNAFVGRFAKLIHWSIRRTLERTPLAGRPDAHDEIFQNVFEKLLRRNELAKLKDSESIRKFLCVMSGRMAADKLKYFLRKSARDLSFDEETAERGEDQWLSGAGVKEVPEDPAQASLTREKNDVIAGVLKRLSPKELACVEFHIFDGKTHNEISRILGFPQDTVSTIIRRAKEKLRKEFSDKGMDQY